MNKKSGIIDSLEPNFGIIRTDNSDDEYFFHFSILNNDYKPKIGDKVEFEFDLKFNSPKIKNIYLIDSQKIKKVKKYIFKEKNDLRFSLEYIKNKITEQIDSCENLFPDNYEFIKSNLEKYHDQISIVLKISERNNFNDFSNINENFSNLQLVDDEFKQWAKGFDLQKFANELVELSKTEIENKKRKKEKKSFELTWGEWRNH